MHLGPSVDTCWCVGRHSSPLVGLGSKVSCSCDCKSYIGPVMSRFLWRFSGAFLAQPPRQGDLHVLVDSQTRISQCRCGVRRVQACIVEGRFGTMLRRDHMEWGVFAQLGTVLL
jgi:hypothetical protein